MVCLGNICRSPLAEGILRKKIEARSLPWVVDSVGTGDWHVGDPPDPRTISVAAKNDLNVSDLRARQISDQDIEDADVIVAMDAQNWQDIAKRCNGDHHQKIELMLNFLHPGQNRSVPDPYFGGKNGFDKVYALLDQACDAMIHQLVPQD